MGQAYTQIDRNLAEAAEMHFIVNEGKQLDKVKFQFPPKITSDNRKANWAESNDVAGQVEPIQLYAASGPREITMQITYIYDGNRWDCGSISQQVRLIRGYFQRVQSLNIQRDLVVRLKLWCIGGPQLMSFRMKSVNVKYSETMIATTGDSRSGFSVSNAAWPVRTDITCDLATWTQTTAPKGAANPEQPLKTLEMRLVEDWY